MREFVQKPLVDKFCFVYCGPEQCNCKSSCDHTYEEIYSDFEKESYKCTKCEDRYSIYYEDIK